eukprot:COSAG04_NODE_697_length_11055_cov_5.640471_7_plen_183_part_00
MCQERIRLWQVKGILIMDHPIETYDGVYKYVDASELASLRVTGESHEGWPVLITTYRRYDGTTSIRTWLYHNKETDAWILSDTLSDEGSNSGSIVAKEGPLPIGAGHTWRVALDKNPLSDEVATFVDRKLAVSHWALWPLQDAWPPSGSCTGTGGGTWDQSGNVFTAMTSVLVLSCPCFTSS